MNSLEMNTSDAASLPVKFRRTSKAGYGLLAASGIAWFGIIAAIIYEFKDRSEALMYCLIAGGLISLVLGPIFIYALVKVIMHLFSRNLGSSARLPFVLHGTAKGGQEMLLFSGVFMLFSYFTVYLGVLGVCKDFDLRAVLLAAFGLFLSALFTTLFVSSWAEIRGGMSRLRVSKEGLQILGSAHARKIAWSEIRRFRLNPTPLMLRIETDTGPDAFRHQEVTGNVKVVFEKGEFELPGRYGMAPCDLRDLLNRARRLCVLGSASPEGPEPFGSPGVLTPVVQNEDLDSLRTSAEHLTAHGFSGSIVPFASLKESERKNWISSARGGYVLCLSVEQDIQKAMQMLAEHLKTAEGPNEQNGSAA